MIRISIGNSVLECLENFFELKRVLKASPELIYQSHFLFHETVKWKFCRMSKHNVSQPIDVKSWNTQCLRPQTGVTLHRANTRIYMYSISISNKTRKLAIVVDVVLKKKRFLSLNLPERIIKIDLKLRVWLSNCVVFRHQTSNQSFLLKFQHIIEIIKELH